MTITTNLKLRDRRLIELLSDLFTNRVKASNACGSHERQHRPDSSALWIDDIPLSNTDVIDLIRRQGAVPCLVQEWVIDRTLADTNLESEFQEQLLRDYRNENDLSSDEAYQLTSSNGISMKGCCATLCRPHQVVRYREERWGPSPRAFISSTKSVSTP